MSRRDMHSIATHASGLQGTPGSAGATPHRVLSSRASRGLLPGAMVRAVSSSSSADPRGHHHVAALDATPTAADADVVGAGGGTPAMLSGHTTLGGGPDANDVPAHLRPQVDVVVAVPPDKGVRLDTLQEMSASHAPAQQPPSESQSQSHPLSTTSKLSTRGSLDMPTSGFFARGGSGGSSSELDADLPWWRRCGCHAIQFRRRVHGFALVGLLVVLLGVLATTLTATAFGGQATADARAIARAEASASGSGLLAYISDHVDTLSTFVGIIDGRCGVVDQGVWARAASRLEDTIGTHPDGHTCLSFAGSAVGVTPGDRAAFEAGWSSTLGRTVTIEDASGATVPAGSTTLYPFVSVWPNPTTDTRRFEDHGIAPAAATRQATAQVARETRSSAHLSAPLTLADGSTGYTLYHGVSTDGGDNCGYLMFDMRADCLLLHLGHAYAAGSVGRLRLPAGFIAAVHDVTDAGGVSAPGWAGELLASSITPDASPQEAVCGGDTEWSGEVDVGGRTWRVTACESQAAFGDSVDDTATIVIILVGVVLTAVAGGVVYGAYNLVDTFETTRTTQQLMEASAITHGRIMTYVCHELRNPLLGVRGCLELFMLDHGDDLPASAVQDILSAQRNAETMHRVLDDVLDQRRIMSGTVDVRPRKQDIRVLLRDVGNQTRVYLSPRSRLELRVSDSVPAEVMIDFTRVRQILVNAVHNACRATESGAVQARLSVIKCHAHQRLVKRHTPTHDSGDSRAHGPTSPALRTHSNGSSSMRARYGAARYLVWDITNAGCGLPSNVQAMLKGAQAEMAEEWAAPYSAQMRALNAHLHAVKHTPVAGVTAEASVGVNIAGQARPQWPRTAKAATLPAPSSDMVMRFVSPAAPAHMTSTLTDPSMSFSPGNAPLSDLSSTSRARASTGPTSGSARDELSRGIAAQGIGAGLGLPLCSVLAAKLGGTMGVRDVFDHGGRYQFTHFYLVLPMVLPGEEPWAPHRMRSSASQRIDGRRASNASAVLQRMRSPSVEDLTHRPQVRITSSMSPHSGRHPSPPLTAHTDEESDTAAPPSHAGALPSWRMLVAHRSVGSTSESSSLGSPSQVTLSRVVDTSPAGVTAAVSAAERDSILARTNSALAVMEATRPPPISIQAPSLDLPLARNDSRAANVQASVQGGGNGLSSVDAGGSGNTGTAVSIDINASPRASTSARVSPASRGRRSPASGGSGGGSSGGASTSAVAWAVSGPDAGAVTATDSAAAQPTPSPVTAATTAAAPATRGESHSALISNMDEKPARTDPQSGAGVANPRPAVTAPPRPALVHVGRAESVPSVASPGTQQAVRRNRRARRRSPAIIVPHAVKHVVVVDDERMVRRLASRMLKKLGVATVTCLPEGTTLLETLQGAMATQPVDCVLLDIVMKTSNGVTTAQQVRRHDQVTPVFAMTANVDDQSLQQYRHANFTGVLGKPFTMGDVNTLLTIVAQEAADRRQSAGVGVGHTVAKQQQVVAGRGALYKLARSSSAAANDTGTTTKAGNDARSGAGARQQRHEPRRASIGSPTGAAATAAAAAAAEGGGARQGAPNAPWRRSPLPFCVLGGVGNLQ